MLWLGRVLVLLRTGRSRKKHRKFRGLQGGNVLTRHPGEVGLFFLFTSAKGGALLEVNVKSLSGCLHYDVVLGQRISYNACDTVQNAVHEV